MFYRAVCRLPIYCGVDGKSLSGSTPTPANSFDEKSCSTLHDLGERIARGLLLTNGDTPDAPA